jgi:FkbM family methyltransferase
MNREFVSLRETRHGLLAYNARDLVIGASIAHYGEWAEAELSGAMLRLIAPGDVVVDVGAAIGTHTLAFSRAVGDRGHVVALEPQLWSHRFLTANVSLNALMNVTVFNAAAGAEQGMLQLCAADPRHATNFGAASLQSLAGGDYAVRVIPVDSFGLTRCSLIKIDVEGEELNVLQGATKTIEQHKPALFIEANRPDDLIPWLLDRDYVPRWFFTPFFNPDNFYGSAEDLHPGAGDINILAVPSARPIEGLPQARVGESFAEAMERMEKEQQ